MKNALVILNYPLQNQINVGHLDLLQIQFENMLNIFDEVHVISPRDNRTYDLTWNKRIIVHPTGCASKATYYLSPISDLFCALKLIKQKNVKAIRALAISSGFVAVLVGKLTGVPAVVSIHADRGLLVSEGKENKLKHFLMNIIEGWTFRNAKFVPVISKYISKCVVRSSKYSKNIVLHYNFADTDLFKPIKHRNKVPILVFVGRLAKFYKIDMLLEALAIVLKNKKAFLKICGDGPERKQFEETARKLKVEKFVKFIGRVDHEKKLPTELAKSDFFISIGGGFTIIEAMACGLPIIGTDIEWTSEIVNNATGMLIQNNAQDLARGILKMVSSNVSDIQKTNRKQAEEKFSLNAWRFRELKLYDKIQNTNQ